MGKSVHILAFPMNAVSEACRDVLIFVNGLGRLMYRVFKNIVCTTIHKCCELQETLVLAYSNFNVREWAW
jgi:hypothetical protein